MGCLRSHASMSQAQSRDHLARMPVRRHSCHRLNLKNLHGFLDRPHHWYLPLLRDWNVHNSVNELNLWSLHGFLHNLNCWNLPLHDHKDVHFLVDELHLGYLHRFLHLLDRGHLSLHDDWHIHDFVDELYLRNLDSLLKLALHHNGHVDDLLRCAILNTFLWNELHNLNGPLHHVWNRNVRFFNGALLDSLVRRKSLPFL